jgi:hypothetical protein
MIIRRNGFLFRSDEKQNKKHQVILIEVTHVVAPSSCFYNSLGRNKMNYLSLFSRLVRYLMGLFLNLVCIAYTDLISSYHTGSYCYNIKKIFLTESLKTLCLKSLFHERKKMALPSFLTITMSLFILSLFVFDIDFL